MEPGWARRTAFASVPLVVIVLLVLGVRQPPPRREVTAFVAGRGFQLAVADTDASVRRGLQGYREPLRDEGMLFVFPAPQHVTMAIKTLEYPVDVVFVDEGMRVVRTVAMQPLPYGIQSAPSGAPVRYVLELPAGTVVAEDIEVGSLFELDAPL